MPVDNNLYPPYQYLPGWFFLALGVVILAVAAILIVARLTRPLIEPPAGPPVPAADPAMLTAQAYGALRAEYFGRLDQIESEYRSGTLQPHDVHARLSGLVRAYVNEYSGLEAPVLTFTELSRRGVPPVLLDALGRYYYPSQFDPHTMVDPLAGIAIARQVVTTWN
ncbi:hypothetical protein M2390_000522 [Mycetocola sp. BIGb0189]|uniref:hypothetical protein n=1 Tax=Mycetocola sp. BIGb0189 TaxID=2940604 RepID=UPI0021674E95|nr:hypothetical protein [Mycetocola sp. BIGb0189]MCS4275361.1 hypothetical protein [Mycetocola sp. BIGb0189]